MHELAIVGAGPVGLAAALAAVHHGIDCLLVDPRAQPSEPDARVFALSYASRLILERLDVWPRVRAPQPIRTVHVSERCAFGATVITADEMQLPALGYVVAHADLVAALRASAAACAIETIAGYEAVDIVEREHAAAVQLDRAGRMDEVEAAVVALAEGGAMLTARMGVVERDYAQSAIAALIEAPRAARDCAYERFTPTGPIALLPLAVGHALIWTVARSEADSLIGLDDEDFARELKLRYGERLGPIERLRARQAFALKLRFAARPTRSRIALIGNSAQTLHPVAGQGFNLGLRDAYDLAQALAYCTTRAQGVVAGVRRYRSLRRVDRLGGTLFTDFLVRGFAVDNPLAAAARSVALTALDALTPAKTWLARRMIFGGPR